MTDPKKDRQTVLPDGTPVVSWIDGVSVVEPALQEDEKGDLCEVWTAGRDDAGDPVPHLYMVTVRVGKTRGWRMHELQADRLFVVRGRLRFALWDGRAASPTYGMLNVFTRSDRSRSRVHIPAGVWHAVQNVGQDEAIFLNLPTRAYDHADPDKYRLPLKNDLIPFDLEDGPGG